MLLCYLAFTSASTNMITGQQLLLRVWEKIFWWWTFADMIAELLFFKIQSHNLLRQKRITFIDAHQVIYLVNVSPSQFLHIFYYPTIKLPGSFKCKHFFRIYTHFGIPSKWMSLSSHYQTNEWPKYINLVCSFIIYYG